MDVVVGDNLSRKELRRVIGQVLGRVAELELQLRDTEGQLGDTQKGLFDTQKQLAESQEELLKTQKELLKTQKELLKTQKELLKAQKQLAAARKNSSNSSKPPSSDIVKPPKAAFGANDRQNKKRRKIGGQPGHPKHKRPMLPPDVIHQHILEVCPSCGGRLKAVPDGTRMVQQVELVATPLRVDEHHQQAYFCSHCNKLHYGPLPPEVQAGGLLGPQLTALVAFLKGACHASFSTIRKFFRDVLKVSVSRGYLAKIIR